MKEKWYARFEDGTETEEYINAEPLAHLPLGEKRRLLRLLFSDKYGRQCVLARHWENRRAN